ncbi:MULTISPECIES: dihydropteroate synthase [Aerococcus]|uniref:dihydropteroate synthase n=1 Tax=Aerococcus TaxID=1375 RepID=UPI00227A1692|nr:MULTISPECIES: dihydropteroate synthase [Aerococcus]MCY3035879.1 dihydropteroate synthase [Aerococcus sp. Group 2]MCY3038974.1 dihydropteroate synthase [Aerococcus sp. Group 2]MCY3040546.1 dihydropteroate synthase [Aerococcus sp. Group 2]MCY3042543.1 dihydropteroate synthase [Aerococcus sp. Group 2]MDK6519991.1 dihydropteroate synthase [Aerococcus urinae]
MHSFVLRDGRKIDFQQTEIMGIINITKNSFYKESRVSEENLMQRVDQFIQEGALILDIGAESTRPGIDPVDEDTEIENIQRAVSMIREKYPNILLSIDTYRATTAEAAILAGADIINDISGLTFDERMADVVAKYQVPIIIMHIKGKPKDMQNDPHYDDLITEVEEFFDRQIQLALDHGVQKNKIILDPGIGFGKNYEHNVSLIKNIDFMKKYQLPILLAVSRKTFIGQRLGGLEPGQRLEGTIAVSCFAAMKGIEMVRVHDVKENLRAIRVMELFK